VLSVAGKKSDLHGKAPDSCPVALLLIDVINDLDFPGNQYLVKAAVPMARRIAALKKRARALNIPAIYVNDNFGKWRSDFRKLVRHCLSDDVPGCKVVQLLAPDDDDYFVLKPKHSGFFSTTLDTLLKHLQVKTVMLTGMAANVCILFTANDAFMRDYNLIVPRDCVASATAEENRYALQHLEEVLHADTRPSAKLNLAKLKRGGKGSAGS
jgi:nicotinamidase-related amidase